MAKAPLYNKEGNENGTVELSDAVFGVKPKQSVVHGVYVALEANRRQPWAHTKDRSDVRGGGRKPWKQKGTGRARHGSSRSPIWSGGGVTFGPLSTRNYKKKVNQKTRALAVKMCLSDKILENKLVVVESIGETGKTKDVRALCSKLPGSGKTMLILSDVANEALGLAVRNIPQVHVQRSIDVNVADLLNHQYIVTTKESIQTLEKRFA